MSRRLVIPGVDLDTDRLVLPAQAVRHVVRVLRLGPGDRLLLLDGRGDHAEAVIEQATRREVTVRLGPRTTEPTGEHPGLHLIQALPKGGKLDEIIRRATELGVASVRPCLARRSVARPSPDRARKRLERWRRIAAEAARQCRREQVPEVNELVDLDAALVAAPADTLRVALWEDEGQVSLAQRLSALEAGRGVTLVIGPEGGFEPEEVRLGRAQGFAPTSVGPLLLRTETAAVAACALAQLYLGALEPA